MDKLPIETITNAPLEQLSIEELRSEVDRLDNQILESIQRRTQISKLIGKVRLSDGRPKLVHSREMQIVELYRDNLGTEGGRIALNLLALGRGRIGHHTDETVDEGVNQ